MCRSKVITYTSCISRNIPYPPRGRSLEIPRGRGVLKAKILEAKYEAKLEIPGVSGGWGGGGAKQQTFCGGKDIFWNWQHIYDKNEIKSL